MLTVDNGIKYLQSAGAKITATRMAILRALENRKDHPSAEQLFLELKPDYPTLSIATVYSTAQLLSKGSLLRILSIDEKKVYFDPEVDFHGHFMCKNCKRVFDLPVDFDIMDVCSGIHGISSVEDAEMFCYGICTECE
ncbi:MAG: transcriptional repressor [Synergistaceae bacterium]|jgi:Fur family peroxide stress response transcriptional regulator|nr:transcriptional repressor [Synergistaceae bacterium]